mgnify:CR=1 FL=1
MQLQEEMEEMRSRLERKVATLRKRLSQVSDLKYIVKLEDDVKSLEKVRTSGSGVRVYALSPSPFLMGRVLQS